ncbi:hypothetical protein [Tabrizicola oligotrophica]|uniref:TIGR03016 family PEP-CTERM system-associated outer membrane protein n=1 Tax=Tabrizicola oligotrophica TaxID=2710650 RepID=A0A6M0QUC9_9RHOB|nr:hypothetical protein [Tabrizicola oligotrophica]NEY90072.1 hypothetical protein [Tabrizicola oligotrophica]
MAGASVRLGLVLALFAAAAGAQTRLGEADPDGKLRISLDEIVPLSRLRVEIDGQPVAVPLALAGRTLIVTLPDGLQGREHDIVVYRRQPDVDDELGIWTFATQTAAAEASFVGTVEVEQRNGPAGSGTVINGNGRLAFALGGDLLRGGLGFVQTGSTRRDQRRTEVSDYFLETRQALFGQDFYARLGTQDLPAESLLADDDSWRGASLRLAAPDGRSEVMAFALHPGQISGLSNLSGLGNPQARLTGFAAQLFPIGTSSLRADALVYEGKAKVAGAGSGAVEGRGMRLSGPVGADFGDFALEFARTATGPVRGNPAASGAAVEAELGVALLPAGHDDSLELRVSATRHEPGFYSPLNPDVIADENTRRAELLFQSDEWQANLYGEQGRSNIADDPALPTDRFREIGLDLTYSPYIFTGGFLQGLTFYGSLYSEDQRRLATPAGGPDPEDFRLNSVSFGVDKFQPDYAWAAGLKLDWLQDLARGGTSERRQRLESAFAWTPGELTTFTLRAEAGRSQKTGPWRRDATLEMSFAFPIVPDRWSASVEAGATRIEGRSAQDGTYLGLEVKRSLSANTAMLLRADYGSGAEADDLAPGRGWVFGLALRHEFGVGTP